MTATSFGAIAVFDFLAGSVAAVGLVYLLYEETLVVHYERFFTALTAGLLAFAVTGPVIGLLNESLIHFVHGLAALSVSVALYLLVDGEVNAGDAGFDEAAFDDDFGMGDAGVEDLGEND